MICKICGQEIDDSIRMEDGTVQCPKCGTVYRRRRSSNPPLASETPEKQRNSDSLNPVPSVSEQRNHDYASILPHEATTTKKAHISKKILGLPLTVVIIIAVVLLGGIVSLVLSSNKTDTTNVQDAKNDPTDPFIGVWVDSRHMTDLYVIRTFVNSDGTYENVIDINDSNGSRQERNGGNWRNLGNGKYELNYILDNQSKIDILTYNAELDEVFLDNESWGIRDYKYDGAKVEEYEYSQSMNNVNNGEYSVGQSEEDFEDYHVEIYPIESIEEVLADGRILVKYNEYGVVGYGTLDQESNLTPLFLDQNAITQRYIPNSVNKSYYSFAALPNGDYCEKVYDGKLDNGGFYIYDSFGQMLYQTQNENGAEKIIGVYKDRILVLHHVSNFSENTWKLYMIDHRGNKLSAEYDVNDRHEILNNGMNDFGCGILLSNYFGGGLDYYRALFNMQTGNYFIIDNWRQYSQFDENTNTALWEDDNPYRYYIVNVESLSSESEYTTWVNKRVSIEDTIGLAAVSDYHAEYSPNMDTFGDGKVYVGNGNFYRITGEYVCAVPSFGENSSIVEIGWFDEGYAPILLKGADNYFYITIIDEKGTCQYNPMKLGVEAANSWGTNTPYFHRGLYEKTGSGAVHVYNSIFFDKGYIFYETKNGLYLINPQGQEIKLPENLSFSFGLENGAVYFTKSFVRVTDPSIEVTEGYFDPRN